MIKRFFHIIFCLTCFTGFGQELDIGIMRDYTLGTLELSHNEGNYEIYGDTNLITNIWTGQTVLFKRSGEKIKVIKADKTIGFYDSLTVKRNERKQQLKNSMFSS